MKYSALIVEDSFDIARLVRMHLKDIGCHADIAGSRPDDGSEERFVRHKVGSRQDQRFARRVDQSEEHE